MEAGMRTLKNSLLLWGLAVILAASLLTGCTEPADQKAASEPTVIDVWHQWADQNVTMESAVEAAANAYEKEHPNVRIELHGMDGETYKTKIIMDFAGNAEDIDVFYYFNSAKLDQLLNAGRILPIDDYIPEETLGKLDADVRDTFCFDGKRYALPIGRGMNVIYCRRDLFEQAGAELPKTYSDLLTEGKKLLDAGYEPLAVGAETDWRAAMLFEELILHEGGSDTVRAMLDDSSKSADGNAVSEQKTIVRTAANDMQELLEAGILGPDPLNETETDAETAFFEGRAAMLLNGTWEAGNIDASGIDPDKIAVIPFPAGPDGAYSEDYIGDTGGGTFFVNAKTDTPDVSADFAIFLTQYLGEHASNLGMDIPVWSNAADSPSPILQKILSLDLDPKNSVPSWDLALSSADSETHLEMSQALLRQDADVDQILGTHD